MARFLEPGGKELSFRIILKKPLPGVVYALQKGSGNNYLTLQAQTADGSDLLFEESILLKGDEGSDEFPDFSGPLVQGKKGARFIYIDIGRAARQLNTSWSRRLKIPLSGVTWRMVVLINTSNNPFLQTSVPGIGKDGGPNCATVKPFPGWQVLNQ